MSANEDELDTDNVSDVDHDDVPEVKDQPGLWDNVLNGVILVAPWVALVAALGYVIYTGSLSTDIVLTGKVPVQSLTYAASALIGVTYILALMKFYGTAPIAYIFEKGHNFMTNYNSGNDENQ